MYNGIHKQPCVTCNYCIRVQDADEKLLQMTTGKAAELVSTVCVCVATLPTACAVAGCAESQH